MSAFVRSSRGLTFSAASIEAVEAMQRQSADSGHVLVAVACKDENGVVDVDFGGDYEPHPNALRDQLRGAEFYWYADPEHLLALRGSVIVASLGQKTRVIRGV